MVAISPSWQENTAAGRTPSGQGGRGGGRTRWLRQQSGGAGERSLGRDCAGAVFDPCPGARCTRISEDGESRRVREKSVLVASGARNRGVIAVGVKNGAQSRQVSRARHSLCLGPMTHRKVIRAASRATRGRAQHSSTRRRLVECASDLFTERGYAGTSLDEVVAAAKVTKGALYHHYSGKRALFDAVFEATEDDAVKEIESKVRKVKDPWERASVGVRAFMDVCREPRFRRIVMQEGPAALGFERFREADERNTYGLVRGIVEAVLHPYEVPAGIAETFTRVSYGAMTSAGMSVASADDPDLAAQEVETVIGLVLAGLRQLVETGPGRLDTTTSRE